MPLSDARKRANKKWMKANIKRFSIDLRKEIFEEFEYVIIDWLKSHK